MLVVQKFGGSSLAGAERLRRAANICLDARKRGNDVVAVVSAMGNTTDELEDLAMKICAVPPAREMDALMTTGEQQSAALMAIMLEGLGVPARSFTGWQAGLFTDRRHGEARIGVIAPGRINAALAEGVIPVVSGYQGVSSSGDITALGRGGSDTTAAALAAALGAEKCEIYTDVDGIYTADPRLVRDARRLARIDYRDMLRLARAGSQVLHPRSVELALLERVELTLKSSFTPGEGSLVCALAEDERPDFAGATRSVQEREVSLVGKAASAEVLSVLVRRLGESGIQVLGGSVSEGCVAVKVAPTQLDEALAAAHGFVVNDRPPAT